MLSYISSVYLESTSNKHCSGSASSHSGVSATLLSIPERRKISLEYIYIYIYIFRRNMTDFTSSILTGPDTGTPLSKTIGRVLKKMSNPLACLTSFPASNIIQPTVTWYFNKCVSNELLWIYTKKIKCFIEKKYN
jgi:hypothetical protein